MIGQNEYLLVIATGTIKHTYAHPCACVQLKSNQTGCTVACIRATSFAWVVASPTLVILAVGVVLCQCRSIGAVTPTSAIHIQIVAIGARQAVAGIGARDTWGWACHAQIVIAIVATGTLAGAGVQDRVEVVADITGKNTLEFLDVVGVLALGA